MLEVERAATAGDEIAPVSPYAFAGAKPTGSAATWTRERLTLLTLSAGFVLAAVLLVIVELAQPAPSPEFKGIRFANTVNSPGSRGIVAMYRDHLEWLPRPFFDNTMSGTQYIWGLRIAWISMFLLQACALLACRHFRPLSHKPWMIGPALAAVVMLVYPPSSTDIYAYASFGWLAEHGANPYLQTPKSLPGDPYATFNDWTHVESPYGPIWTGISRAIVHLSNQEPFWTGVGFKLVATIAAFGLAVVTYHLAKRFTSQPHLAVIAFVFVWWSPILITESAATVHLDSLVMFLAMLGLAVATGKEWRSHRLGVVLIVASALVKPATLPLIGLMLAARFARREPTLVVLKRIALDLLASAALIAVAYAPFWSRSLPSAMFHNFKELYADEALRSNPLWMWGLAHVGSATGFSERIGGDVRDFTRWAALVIMGAIGFYFLRKLRDLRLGSDGEDSAGNAQSLLRFMVWAWAIILFVLGTFPVNVHPWYVTWALGPFAILWISDGLRDRQRPPSWLLVIQGWIIISFMVYHTLPKG